jgi:hypothetical protein
LKKVADRVAVDMKLFMPSEIWRFASITYFDTCSSTLIFHCDVEPPTPDAVRVSSAPENLRQIYDFVAKKWGSVPASIDEHEDAIQDHFDGMARLRKFRDRVTLASYAAPTNEQWRRRRRLSWLGVTRFGLCLSEARSCPRGWMLAAEDRADDQGIAANGVSSE